MIEVGQNAPNFSLSSHRDNTVGLEDYRGDKHVVLVFYPLDFSPVCSIQLPEYSGRKAEFDAANAVVLGVNRDSVYTHKAWAAELGLELELLADMAGDVAKAYGVYINERGMSKRAVFIIDKAGVVRFVHVENSPGEFTVHADALLEQLQQLNS